MSQMPSNYYLPDPSPWPIIAVVSVFSIFLGAGMAINGLFPGVIFIILGFVLFGYLMFGWFGDVV